MSQLPESPRKPAPTRRRACMRGGCIAVITCLVVFAAAILYYRHVLYSRLSPEVIAQARQTETQILELPDSWHKPATLPTDEVLAFWDKFAADTAAIVTKH